MGSAAKSFAYPRKWTCVLWVERSPGRLVLCLANSETSGKMADHTVQQLGYSINLLASVTASLGFAFNLLEHFNLSACWNKLLFDGSLLFLLVSVALGIVCTVNRLCDFRKTMSIARDREKWNREQCLRSAGSDNEIDCKLSERRSETKRLGRRTWRLFYGQIATFGLGILFLVCELALSYRSKLF